MSRHLAIDTTDAPRIWRNIGSGMRVRIIDPDWMAAALAAQKAKDQRLAILRAAPSLDTRASRIVARICLALNVTIDELRSPDRTDRISFVRACACYWLRRLTKLSLQGIGNVLGGIDHSSVSHAVKSYPARRAARVVA